MTKLVGYVGRNRRSLTLLTGFRGSRLSVLDAVRHEVSSAPTPENPTWTYRRQTDEEVLADWQVLTVYEETP